MTDDTTLIDRIAALTNLNKRASQVIASELLERNPDSPIGTGEIVRMAEELGYDFPRPEGVEIPAAEPPKPRAHDAEVTMDPAEVLDFVYESMPRVLCEHMPVIGKAPDELRELDADLVDQLPEDVRALLVKIDQFEGKATFWLRDEANQVDRPIGPIDLSRYQDGHAIHEAFTTLMRRLPKVLAADFN